MSLLKLREFIFGRGSRFGSTVSSSLTNAQRLSPGYGGRDPGPFDDPPDHEIVLEDQVPRELRDGNDQRHT